MKAILFGSLSVLADTSELQRTAFNAAFLEAGLDWNWSQDEYRTYLESSGGEARITAYATAQGDNVDAKALHARKSEIFQNALESGSLGMRAVAKEMFDFAKTAGIDLAFVSTSSKENVDALLGALDGVDSRDFALVTSSADAVVGKPDAEIYKFVLAQMDVLASDVIAVEDNVAGVEAAQAAGITCFAYPNQNTVDHDFGSAAPVEQWQQIDAV